MIFFNITPFSFAAILAISLGGCFVYLKNFFYG